MSQTYPGGEARLLQPVAGSVRSMRSHDILCLHTMVGYLVSTDHYFRISNGIGTRGTESHYGVGGKWGPDLGGNLDGHVWQWQRRNYAADANYDGWDRVISIETADNAKRPIAPWTPKQVAAIIKLLTWECSPAAHRECPPAWECHKVGIPAALIPDTKPGRRGIGYHRQGCQHSAGVGARTGWLVRGGERWSLAIGKDCPTQARIDQLTKEIIPAVAKARAGGPALPAVSVRRLRRAATTKPYLLAPVQTRHVQKALAKTGYLKGYSVPGRFGPRVRDAYAAFQRSLGYSGADANGIPGEASLRKLAAKTKLFTVTLP